MELSRHLFDSFHLQQSLSPHIHLALFLHVFIVFKEIRKHVMMFLCALVSQQSEMSEFQTFKRLCQKWIY